MIIIISIMAAGIILGRFLRNRENAFLHKTITYLIWVLLFLLGVEVGVNRDVVSLFNTLGAEALVLTIFGLAGSIIFTSVLWYFVSKDKNKGEKA